VVEHFPSRHEALTFIPITLFHKKKMVNEELWKQTGLGSNVGFLLCKQCVLERVTSLSQTSSVFLSVK
jgi:hypothetical protein